MSRRGTITLFVLAFAMMIWWVVDAHQQRPSNGPLFLIQPDKVSRITIMDGNDSHILQRDENGWTISTTPQDRASETEVMRLLTLASEVKPLNILKPQELKNKLSLSSLGLQNPKRSLTLHQEGEKDQTIFIGNEAVGEKSLFARVNEQKAVVIIPSTLAEAAFRTSDDFRDPHLSALSFQDLQEVVVTRGLSKLCLKKENEEWKMTQPITALMPTDVLEAWITPLLSGEVITRVGSDDQDLARYGLDQPCATITLRTDDESQPLMLSLGNLANEASSESAAAVYVRSSTRHSIFKIPASLASIFMISPEALRDRQFFQLNLDTVDRIEITVAENKMLLHRQPGKSENWILNDESQTIIPAIDIENMVTTLEKTKVISFQPATPAKLAAAGLEKASTPTASVRFIAHLSENTPDEEAGDRTVLELTFGKIVGKTLFARMGEMPEFVEIPAETLSLLKIK